MSCLYLHIGTPKTGTSSIQFFCVQNRKLLKSKGYSYPDLGYRFPRTNPHHNGSALIHAVVDENGKRDLKKEKEVHDQALEKVLDCLKRSDNVILSAEGIWSNFYREENFWENIFQAVTKHGHTLKVIVYLRRQDLFVQSYWAQSVEDKKNIKVSFVKYLDTMDSRPYIHCNYIDYLHQISDVVGKENMIVRPFEVGQFCTYNGKPSLIADFLSCIGLTLSEEYKGTEEVRNSTMDGEYVEIKRIINNNAAYAPYAEFFVHCFNRATARRSQKPNYKRAAAFPEGRQTAFYQQFAAGNAQVAKEYLNREDGVLFAEPVKESEPLPPYSSAELITACGDVVLDLKQKLDELKAENKIVETPTLIQKAKNRIKRLPIIRKYR